MEGKLFSLRNQRSNSESSSFIPPDDGFPVRRAQPDRLSLGDSSSPFSNALMQSSVTFGSLRTHGLPSKPASQEPLRIASRIWGGQVEHDSYRKLLERVRQQFKTPQLHGHEPLIFPPVIPSAARPNHQEIPRFSRAVRLAAGHLKAEGDLPPSSTRDTPSVTESSMASLPIYDLEDTGKKIERLLILEEIERQRLENTEKWDRNIVHEMLVVHYVTYVLKPEMEKIQANERHLRGMIRYEEENDFFLLYNESPLAQLICKESRALREKEAKVARLHQLELKAQKNKTAMSSPVQGAALPKVSMGKSSHESSGLGSEAGFLARWTEKAGLGIKKVETRTLPDRIGDARVILQNYVKQKYSDNADRESLKDGNYIINEGRRVSSLPLPAISTAVARPQTLGVADYLSLLDEDDQYRALIEVAEREELKEIHRLMRDDWKAVMDWQRKSMHLQRLIYWRTEREKSLKCELEQLSRTERLGWTPEEIALLDALNAEEEEGRQSVDQQEDVERNDFYRTCQSTFHLSAQEALVYSALERRAAIELAFGIGLCELAVEQEHSARTILYQCHDDFVTETVLPKTQLLQELYAISIDEKAMKAVHCIQHAYYLYRRGLMGFRRTHQLIAQEIHANRTRKDLESGLASFQGYRQQVQEEINAINAAAQKIFDKGYQLLDKEQYSDCLLLISNEAREWNELQRKFVRALRDEIIGGEIKKTLEGECEQRLEISVKEDIDFCATLTFLKELSNLILEREFTITEEMACRKKYFEEGERLDREALYQYELDRREELRFEAEDRAAKLAEERALYAVELEGERASLEEELAREHFLFVNRLGQKAVTKCAFEHVFYEESFEEATEAVIHSWGEWALELHLKLGWSDCCAHQELIHLREVELHEENEKLHRRELEKMEENMFFEIRGAYEQMLEDTKEHLNEEQWALRVLCRTWRAYRNGDLGRSATRKFLHEAFRPKRERAEIARRNAENKAHIEAVKAALGSEEAKYGKDVAQRIALELSVLEDRTETRKRWELEDKEEMEFTVMRNNFYSSCVSSFDPRNRVALLWQHESCERVLIKKEWMQAFKKVFYPRKAVFKEDVLIRRIQRAWRAYVERRRLFAIHDAQQETLIKAELSDRFYTMEREAVLFRDLFHEVLRMESHVDRWFHIAPLLVLEQQQLAWEALVDEEWNARADILFAMCYDAVDGELISKETKAREVLLRDGFFMGLEHSQLCGDETLTRGLLENERIYFLLRILTRQEAVHRESLRTEELGEVQESGIVLHEKLAREAIVDEYCDTWKNSIFGPLVILGSHEIKDDEEREREWLEFLAEESAARMECLSEEVLARQQCVQLIEFKARGLIHTNEFFYRQREEMIWYEERDRQRILHEWACCDSFLPSEFAPHHVCQKVHLYIRCIEETEMLVREYLEQSEMNAIGYIYGTAKQFLDEETSRMELSLEECIIRAQRYLLQEEQQARTDLIREWMEGIFFVPSTFSPEIVNQRLRVFLDGVQQTESLSRTYVLNLEDITFAAMIRERQHLEREYADRLELDKVEALQRLISALELDESSERERLVQEFQAGLVYSASSFAPTMVYTAKPIYVRYVTDTEELVRQHIIAEEADFFAFYQRLQCEELEKLALTSAHYVACRAQWNALEEEEKTFRRVIWLDAFDFIRREKIDAEGSSPCSATSFPTPVDEGEDAAPAPLPPIEIQNERYTTFVNVIESLERLSRMHIWHKHLNQLMGHFRHFFPGSPYPGSEEDGFALPEDFEDSSSEDVEDDEEDEVEDRSKTMMMLRKTSSSTPEYFFKRDETN